MQNKMVKIIYFSVTDSDAKQIELSWGKFSAIFLSAFIILLILVSATIALFTDFYQNMEIASLSKLNGLLTTQLSDMGSKINQIETKIADLENEDDNLRIVANLPIIDSDTRDVGVGGFVEVNYEMPVVSEEISDRVLEFQHILDKMERRIELTKVSRDEIRVKLEENKTIMKHTPSIKPLINGQIRDKFGFRLHPIIEKIRHHDGVDIAAERGTEVFATAAGVVEKVVTNYKLNRGYGKYIIIDHGFGLKTKYGHLAKILVRKGQKVDRWKPIGLVGETGLATGPHLHYEVIRDGKQIDPVKFILN
ncbi:MAG: M23 family metallopeptidase [bacterium]